MSALSNRREIAALAATGALLLAAFAATSQAQAQTIYACYKKKSGSIHIVTKGGKCKKGESKVSWNSEGPAGKNGTNGTNGTNGAPGKEGAAGKEGPAGKEGVAGKTGNTGPEGTALAYAEVSSTGTLGSSKGVVKMTPGASPGTGVYCLDIPGTLHTGVATSNSLGGGVVPSIDAVDMAPIFEVLFEECAAGTTVAVHTYNDKGEAAAAGFFLNVN